MNKKMVNHPLFHEPVELTRALVTVAAATIYAQDDRDNYDYALMMEAADRIRYLETLVDLLTPLAQCGRKSLNIHLIEEMNNHFARSQKELSPEFIQIVEENFWELLA